MSPLFQRPFAATRFPLFMGFLLFAAMLMVSAQALAEARVYELGNRSAEDVADQIRPLYQSTPITISARGQQLIVRGEPQLLDEIGTLVETMDVAPAQLRITVRSSEDIGGKRSGAGVSGTENQIGVTVERKVISTGNQRQRSLIVQDGQSAHITSGKIRTLPLAVRGGRNPAAILQQVETRSGFLVSPQVISSQTIELNIMSFEEDPAAMQGYETEAVMTIRRVEPGQWVSLGSISSQSSRQQSGITYSINSNQQSNRSFDVKVDILP
ncbi:secretin N-terminal domain-containing protein [Marinobacter salinexigens]|uniref:secretin N-terminal domain-containing protein n=1 Tax=Marinobacter salinexigens TaxID=2919747 RepID=UPI003F661E20